MVSGPEGQALLALADQVGRQAERAAHHQARGARVLQAAAEPLGERLAGGRRPPVAGQGHAPRAREQAPAQALPLAPQDLVGAVLERLRCDLVHPQGHPLGDPALIQSPGGVEGRPQPPDGRDLQARCAAAHPARARRASPMRSSAVGWLP